MCDLFCEAELLFLSQLPVQAPGSRFQVSRLQGSSMAKPMDNMPYSEFNKWLSSPSFTGPVGLVAKLYVKEVLRG